MFESLLHLPELTDNYFTSLLFGFSIILVFFSADCWLLTKDPSNHRNNIKLIDFIVSRFRLIVPLVFFMTLVFIGITNNFKGGFFCGTVFTAFSLYGSVFSFKFYNKRPERHTLIFWVVMILGMSIYIILMTEYLTIGIPIGLIGFVLYGIVLDFIFKKLEKVNHQSEK